MKCKGIYSPKRMRKSTVKNREDIDQFYSDQSRIVFSSSFRRLQQKAQVFSLEPNSSVRTRLTHSIEVADLGHTLARDICKELKRKKLISNTQAQAIPIIVRNACLVHDIGNPPFGHFGEAAIKDWMKKNLFDYAKQAGIGSKSAKIISSDFLSFDGNPQGLRTLMRLHCETDDYGLNLTYPTLLSTIKYPCVSGNVDEKNALYKKAGYFYTEQNRMEKIYGEMEWKAGTKYPLAYIMEAADDIAYCMSDISDGIEKRIITMEEFWRDIQEEWDTNHQDIPFLFDTPQKKELQYFNLLSVKWSGKLRQAAVNRFVNNYSLFYQGEVSDIFTGTPEGLFLDTIKAVSRKRLYRSIEAESIEISGYSVIYGLLNHFGKLLLLEENEFKAFVEKGVPPKVDNKNFDLEWRIYNRLSKRLIKNYKYQCEHCKDYSIAKNLSLPDLEWWLRVHLIVDHISGMTDAFALETYQMFEGIIRL